MSGKDSPSVTSSKSSLLAIAPQGPFDPRWARPGADASWVLITLRRRTRFAEVFEIRRERYGPRLGEVRPTPASGTYLYGDKLSAPDTIDALNASLTDT